MATGDETILWGIGVGVMAQAVHFNTLILLLRQLVLEIKQSNDKTRTICDKTVGMTIDKILTIPIP